MLQKLPRYRFTIQDHKTMVWCSRCDSKIPKGEAYLRIEIGQDSYQQNANLCYRCLATMSATAMVNNE
jgi:hypothetical protein